MNGIVDWMAMYASVLLSTLGIAIIFGVEKKDIPWCLIASVLCCTTYEVTGLLGGGLFVSTLLGSAVAAAYSDIMAHFIKVPATVMIILGIIVLVPGGKLYYTMLGAVSSDMDAFYANGKDALVIAAGLAIGIIAVTAISRPVNALISERKMKKEQENNK